MLQTGILWLSDEYKVKLREKERATQDIPQVVEDDRLVIYPHEYLHSLDAANVQIQTPKASSFSQIKTENIISRFSQGLVRSLQGQSEEQSSVSGKSEEDIQDGFWKSREADLVGLFEDGSEDEEKENQSWLRTATSAHKPRSDIEKKDKKTYSRPSSAMPATRTLSRGKKLRPASASASMSMTSALRRSSSSGTLALRHQRMRKARQAWDEDASKGLHISGPNSAPLFVDRHARCLDHGRPYDASWPDGLSGVCGGLETPPVRPGTPTSGDRVSPRHQQQCQTPVDPRDRLQRYAACHRPQTAPATRQEWSRIFKQNRGLTVKGRPHFCNFVNQASLHHRFGRDHSRPFSGHSELSGRSRRSEADHEVVSQWKNNGRLFRRQSGTQGRPGSPSSADDGHIRDDVDLLTEVMGGPTNIQRGGDTDALNNKTIPTVNFPSTPSQQSEPPPGTLRHQTEESRTKSSKDESTSKSSTSAKSKSSKSSSSRGAGKPLPADGQDEAGRDKRQNVSKKGKKCHDRHHSRKGAEGEGGNAPQTEEAAETTKASPEAGENLLDVNVKVPDLPHARTPRRDPGRSPSNKGERRLIPPPSEGRQMLPHELLDLNLYHSTGFDFGDMHASTDDSSKKKQTSWMNDRMALSQQSSRFELPMDMKELEKITPQEYLKSYCIVTSRRLSLYQKVFIKHKDRSNYLNKEGLTQCLKEVLIEMLKDSTLSDLFQLADISEETLIDFRLFSGIAALAERMLYPYYTTVDTADKSEYQRAIIETADFGALSWKLSGVKVTEGTRKLLETLNGCSSVRMEK